MSVPFLESDKIVLRGLRREDLELYRRWLENPEATHFMESGWRPVSDAEIEEIYKASTEPSDTAVFVIVDDREHNIARIGQRSVAWSNAVIQILMIGDRERDFAIREIDRSDREDRAVGARKYDITRVIDAEIELVGIVDGCVAGRVAVTARGGRRHE